MKGLSLVNPEYGSTRIVFPLRRLGIVVKIARINPFWFLQGFLKYALGPSRKLLLCRWQFDPEITLGLSYRLLRGVHANLLEFQIWRRYRHPVLAPTLVSLGLFNIQKMGKVLAEDEMLGLWSKFVREFGQKSVSIAGSYLFQRIGNFGQMDDGTTRFLDYGSRRHKEMMAKYRDRVYTVLNS